MPPASYAFNSLNWFSYPIKLWARQQDESSDIDLCLLNETNRYVNPLSDVFIHFSELFDDWVVFQSNEIFQRASGFPGHLTVRNTVTALLPSPLTAIEKYPSNPGKAFGQVFYTSSRQGIFHSSRTATSCIVDFDLAFASLCVTSNYFASLKPNLQLDAQGNDISLDSPVNAYYNARDVLSDPTGISKNTEGTLKGPNSQDLTKDGCRLVINVSDD
ncbi:hypothetical protein BDA99DRAFT_536376 [Phascolomyces articulosus]|uniref:Uncharacterized protein n=1 Tax=Phascolomyces articulosus TaxID=60185 RepID=A0AAD5PGD1_9FUNG|nr:hypothetical protein BDA99DRAFT_536376 [Phascolomyces articulosus]